MSNNKSNVIVLSLVLTLGMLLPIGASAQNRDQYGGLFGGFGWYYYLDEEEQKENGGGLFRAGVNDFNCNLFNQNFSPIFGDDIAGYNLYNQSFEEVPLGSGLLILTAAGAGYALKKRKSNKK